VMSPPTPAGCADPNGPLKTTSHANFHGLSSGTDSVSRVMHTKAAEPSHGLNPTASAIALIF
jgi:hypothetical protein